MKKISLTQQEISSIDSKIENFSKKNMQKPNILIIPHNIYTLNEKGISEKIVNKYKGLFVIKSDFPIEGISVGYLEIDEKIIGLDSEFY